MAYATTADVTARSTRAYTSEEEQVIAVLLEDAAVMIDSYHSEASEDAKKVVSCRMVVRAMGDGATYGPPMGATQGSMAAGGYTQSWTMSGGATGELYIGKAERQILGSGNRIGCRSPLEGMAPHD